MLFNLSIECILYDSEKLVSLVVAEIKWRECGGNDMGSIATDAL